MPSNPNSSHRTPPPLTDYSLHLNSLTGSHETGPSDPLEWHNDSSHNATANNDAIDVNVPFYRKESDLWNPEKPDLHTQYQAAPPIPITAHSSSVDDYRSVIDDLTLEIQQLRKELKRYKQPGPALLHKDKLFEIKVHGLPQKKKRELEAILRGLTTDLDGSPEVSSLQKRTKISPHNRDHIYSKSGIQRKRAPSSPGSSLRLADSAYASMSAGAESSSTSFNLPILTSTQSSKGKVEDHLRDVPDGLYPRHVIMTDKDRKSLVVRRLEQLFTGRSNGADISKIPLMRPGGSFIMARVVADAQVADPSSAHEPPTRVTEPIREARILPLEQRSRTWGNKCHSSDRGSASDPNNDNMETGGNDKGLVSGTKPFPPLPLLPKQRPTRPCDLDPNRAQIPSENMNYIRHLDLLLPELLPGQQSIQDVHLDAEGWVSLNLLYNLAQLHLINVTPDFVRSAVSGISTRFQLSPDGHKIRWRGGFKDTKFSSHSSGYDSQESPSFDDIQGLEKKRKCEKTSPFISNESQSCGSSKDMPAFDPQLCARVESFRYKPLFAQQDSSDGHTSRGVSVGSPIVVDDENPGESDLGLKYSAGSVGKWQRHEGAITYYSGAPFCIDLTGDPEAPSPTTRTPSSAQTRKDSQQPSEFARPLTDRCQDLRRQTPAMGEDNNEVQDLINDDSEQSSDIELDLIWNDDQQYMGQQPLEPCGLGGVLPDDHFMVVVDTKRPKQDILPWSSEPQSGRSNESIEGIIHRRAAILTSCPAPGGSEAKTIEESPSIGIEYLSWRIERLIPVPLPSPARFFPPFSTDNSTSGEDDDLSIDADNIGSTEEHMS
ncbi:frequency clock protein [Fusarium redolens]|uniref:Frequency clock protein n=1 Tax=Fusarium redolens TaxID=48865 RepID=A0A9P9G2P7_FUSRE|nr:frequency clock protein [Fusarium redolens]XP_046043442.1 frequency clock protein [Fusarium redolens]KAH7205486.1 frequency clock protein [Fusarium redolens]KAH7231333.1 frequency clock protein [Fusarium redolens]